MSIVLAEKAFPWKGNAKQRGKVMFRKAGKAEQVEKIENTGDKQHRKKVNSDIPKNKNPKRRLSRLRGGTFRKRTCLIGIIIICEMREKVNRFQRKGVPLERERETVRESHVPTLRKAEQAEKIE